MGAGILQDIARSTQPIWGCTTLTNLIPEELMQMMVSAGLRKQAGLESATDHIRSVQRRLRPRRRETVRTAAGKGSGVVVSYARCTG